MKTILVATDFSEAAYNAVFYAYELSKSFDAQLIVYAAYHEMPVILPEMPLIATPEDMHRFIEEQLKYNLVQLNIQEGADVKTICAERPAAIGIIETAKANNADIIVVGMKKQGKNIRKIFGTTAASVISKSNISVLVIPEKIKYHPFLSIALAYGGDLTAHTSPKLFKALEDLAIKFRSHVYLVHVAKDKTKAALGVLYSPSKLKRMVNSLKPDFDCVEGKSIAEGLNEFVKSHKIDLLVTLSHQHTLVSQWVGRSATRNLLFELAVPLLALPVEINNKHQEEMFRKEIVL